MDLADVAVTEVVVEDRTAAGAASAIGNLEKIAGASEETGKRSKRGLALLDEAIAKTGGAAKAGGEAFKEMTRAQSSAVSELARLKASYDPVEAVVQKLARAEATLDRAIRQGITTDEEKIRIMDLVRQKTAQAGTANDNFARSAATATGTGRNMGAAFQQAGFQIGDFAVQVASGQGVLRPLIQQGTQLVSMFGAAGAVVGAAGAVVGALAMSLLDFGDAAADAERAAKGYDRVVSDVEGNLKRATTAGREMRAGLAEEGGTVADLERYYRSLSATMREVEAIRLTASRNKVVEGLAEQRTAVSGLLGQLDDLNAAAERMAEFRKTLNERRQGLGAAPLSGLPKEVTDVTDAIQAFKASDSPEAIGRLAVALDQVAKSGGPFSEQARKAAEALVDPATRSADLADKLKLVDANLAVLRGTATAGQAALLSYGDGARKATSEAQKLADTRVEALSDLRSEVQHLSDLRQAHMQGAEAVRMVQEAREADLLVQRLKLKEDDIEVGLIEELIRKRAEEKRSIEAIEDAHKSQAEQVKRLSQEQERAVAAASDIPDDLAEEFMTMIEEAMQ